MIGLSVFLAFILNDWFVSVSCIHTSKEFHKYLVIGTLFLWLFWPSFNGALAGDDGNARHRSIVNTLLSISSSAFTGFLVSRLMRHEGKFNMVDIQNATLAGGVAMGAAANMLPRPWGAMFIGAWAGVLSTFGFIKVQPFLDRVIGLKDTCGVHNLHGMPSIYGAICSVILAAISNHTECLYLSITSM
jgi:ammonium transporter Rh